MSDGAALLQDDKADKTAGVAGDKGAKAAADAGKDGKDVTSKTNGNGKSADGANGGWYTRFSEGLEEATAKDWTNFSSRYQSEQDFAKSFVELRKSSIIVPKDDAKPEAWDEVYNRLGRPAKPEEYKWNHLKDAPALDEGEQEVRNSFGPVAHRLGINQKQMDGVLQWHDQQRKIQTDALTAKSSSIAEDNLKSLKTGWKGDEFNTKVQHYRNAVKAYAADDFDKLKTMRKDDGTFVLDDPAIVRLFARIGEERAEDTRYGDPFNASGAQSAMTEIAKIENDAIAKGLNPTHPSWPHDVLKPLYDRAYGTKPIVGGAPIR